MANFEAYQEYQRIEDFEEDSPPGEEDLLVHVPEGLKGKHVILIKKNNNNKAKIHAHQKVLNSNNIKNKLKKKNLVVLVKQFWVCGYLMLFSFFRLMASYQELG